MLKHIQKPKGTCGAGFFWLLLVGLLAGFPAHAALEVHTLTPPIKTTEYKDFHEDTSRSKAQKFIYEGREHSYYLYAPMRTDTTKPLPVLLLFHGTARTGMSMIETWKHTADQHGILLVAPDAYSRRNWDNAKDGADFLLALLAELHRKHPLDGQRIYAFGHSAGGYFAIDLALRGEMPCAAYGIHAGALPAAQPLMWLRAKMAAEKPVVIVTGTHDVTVPLNNVRKAAKLLGNNGFVVALYELEGHNHWYYTLAHYINRLAWNEMSNFKLAAPYVFGK